MSNVLSDIKECILTKRYGCFVVLAAVVLTLLQIFVYPFVPETLFHPGVIVSAVFGVLLFAGLSLFKKTSSLAPVALMVCNLLALVSFAGAEGLIDEFSTRFFDGFSLGKLFEMPAAAWLSILSIILSFVISSVAVYLPQNRKTEAVKEKE